MLTIWLLLYVNFKETMEQSEVPELDSEHAAVHSAVGQHYVHDHKSKFDAQVHAVKIIGASF